MRGSGMLISVYRGPSYSSWKMGSDGLDNAGMTCAWCSEVVVGAESSIGKGEMSVVVSMVCDSLSFYFFALGGI